MTQFIHTTNRSTPNAPVSSEIQQGEIVLNTANLGNSSAGISNGRLYIKTNAGEVRRFISVGLSDSVDPALKVKYGGTNNTFGDLTNVSANTDGGDSILVIQRDSLGNHVINRTATNKLTWNSGINSLNINRTSAALATLHVGGSVAIDTIADRTQTFDGNFYVLGASLGATHSLRRILSTDFMSYIPNNTIPISKISGSIPVADNSVSSAKISGLIALNKGGTNNNFSSAIDGSIVYYSGEILTHSSNFRYDGLTSTFILGGAFEFDAPPDTLDNANPIGVNSANKIVRMDYTYDQNLTINSNVEFSKLSLTGFGTDKLVIDPITTEAGADFIGINMDGEVVRMGNFSTDQSLIQTSNVVFNKLTINNSSSAPDALLVNNMPTAGSPSVDRVLVIDNFNRLCRTNYTIDQDLKTTDNVNFQKITIGGGAGAGATLVLNNLQLNTGGNHIKYDTATGNVFYETSSKRFKENIEDYSKGLQSILSINPKYFNMIDDPNKKTHVGLIAEDLVDIGLNEFVIRDKDDNPNGIHYDKLVALLINAIKELKHQIDNISSN